MADPTSPLSSSYAFAGFRFDPRARAITRGDERIALPPKSLECLAYLLEHRDRAVGRDELIAAVWGRADVGYPVLAQTLWKARRALGEGGGESSIVRTVSRYGYQWVAPVERVDAAPVPGAADETIGAPAAAEAKSTDAASSPHSRARRRRLLAVALAIGLGVLLAGAALWQMRRAASPPAASTASVPAASGARFLVLPVALSADGSDSAWMRLGVMDYLAARLRESGEVAVMPSDRVLALLGQHPQFDAADPAQLMQLKLVAGVSYVVAPRAERVDGTWKLSVAVYAGDAVEAIETRAPNPLQAANDAVGRVLRSAGLSAKPLDLPSDPLDELLQRVDAASLAGDYARALELARSAPSSVQQDERLRVKIAQAEFRRGRLDEAATGFQRLIDSAEPLSGATRTAARMGLASIDERRQRYPQAIAGYGEALALLGTKGDPALIGQAHMMRGLAEGYLGQIDASLADFGRARVAMTRAGDPAMLANLDTVVGLAERARGRYGEAAAAFERSIDVLERFGMRDRLASALIGAAGSRLALLDLPQALALGERGWKLAAGLDNPILANYLAVVYGNALLANGRLSALDALLQQLGGAAEVDNAGAVPDLLLLRIDLSTAQGRPAFASDQLAPWLDRIERPAESTYRTSLGGAMLTLIGIATRSNDAALAERLLEHLRSGDAAGDELRPLALQVVEAETLALKRDPGAAAHFAVALAAVDRGAYPDALVSVCVAWARHLDDAGDREAATMLAGRLAPFVERDFRAARAASKLYRQLGEHELAAAAAVSAARLAGERDPQGPL
ncbi:winged helix-turn-helix domain-containing protein [Dokdonella sp.]|uniref:winged helix-turn-helix domain-containing protein n=1 Tax=Dokdonella sp. TaxID=2291710 RepID=UPI001B25521C|nr:winged helix-turn-helix domain-containing protein [Dokdonella sp.]MBO9663959.1 winged helix-turn-helix domain-containing protein [Dokdonella sp.]